MLVEVASVSLTHSTMNLAEEMGNSSLAVNNAAAHSLCRVGEHKSCFHPLKMHHHGMQGIPCEISCSYKLLT